MYTNGKHFKPHLKYNKLIKIVILDSVQSDKCTNFAMMCVCVFFLFICVCCHLSGQLKC